MRPVAGKLGELPGLTVYGIRSVARWPERAPTVSFRISGRHPREVAEPLGREGVCVWDANFYGREVTERLVREGQGGLVRVGALRPNSPEEIRQLREVLRRPVPERT